jgi:peptidoglycan/LPS O-acetylase OafA/YrhL
MAAVLCMIGEFSIVLAIATLSFYFFESPFLRLKRYYGPERREQGSGTGDTNVKPLASAEVVQA